MPAHMKHGVVSPAGKAANKMQRIVSSRTKVTSSQKIKLDILTRLKNPKICIKRRLGGIGDVIMTMPTVKAIKKLLPHSIITYATDIHYANGSLAEVARHNNFIDFVVSSSSIVDKEFDYIVDLTTTGLSRERKNTIPPNRIDMFAEEVGLDISLDPVPVYEISTEEKLFADEWFSKNIDRAFEGAPVICLQPRSNDVRRTWPFNRVQELIKLFSDAGYITLLMDWGSSISKWDSIEYKGLIKLFNLPFIEAAALLNKSDIVVCPDSALLHLAGALNKKIVTIFGPIPPESRINHYANATAVVHYMNCSFCWYSPTCAKSDHSKLDCLTSITGEEVFKIVEKKLKEPEKIHSSIVYGKSLSDRGQDPIILVKRTTSGIGDALMVTPTLEALKTAHPTKQIEVACQDSVRDVYINNPNVSKIINYNENYNPRRYYMIIDLSSPCAKYETARVSTGKPVQKNRSEIYAEAAGIRNLIRSLKPLYYPIKEELDQAKEFIDSLDKTKETLAISFDSAEEYRSYPKEQQIKFIEKIKNKYNVVLLSNNHKIESGIDISDRSLRNKVAILSLCDKLVTVDTSYLHFGAAFDKKTIALFGPIDYRARCKGYKNVTVIQADCACIPCWRNSIIPCKITKKQGYSYCISNIKPEHIASSLNTI